MNGAWMTHTGRDRPEPSPEKTCHWQISHSSHYAITHSASARNNGNTSTRCIITARHIHTINKLSDCLFWDSLHTVTVAVICFLFSLGQKYASKIQHNGKLARARLRCVCVTDTNKHTLFKHMTTQKNTPSLILTYKVDLVRFTDLLLSEALTLKAVCLFLH